MKIARLLAGTAVAGIATLAMSQGALAVPYAFAGNQISNLAFSFADGTPLPPFNSGTEGIQSSTTYDGFPGGVNSKSGAINSAVSFPQQVYSGPGPLPPRSYTPLGPGSFTGSRADANITAKTATGVGVNNVAEAFGNAFGTAESFNTATITFTVVGTGHALQLSFTDLVDLIASSSPNPQETATATITNTFSVTDSSGATIFDSAPGSINKHIGSQVGVPPSASYSGSFPITLVTPVLADGVTYNLSLRSDASATISPAAVPEPASLALFGVGLLGLGMTVARRRRAI